jgi:hypothetical protein
VTIASLLPLFLVIKTFKSFKLYKNAKAKKRI